MPTSRPMQLGMVGLGRMGAGIVRRLMRDGHSCVVFDVNPEAVTRPGEGGGDRGDIDGRLRREADPAAGRLGDGARRRDHRHRPSTTWRPTWTSDDIIIDGGNSYYRDDIRRAAALGRARHPPHRLRDEWRGVGDRPGLLPDDRRSERGGRASATDLRHHRSGPGLGAPHAGADGGARRRRTGLLALRPERGRPLRQDGPQRDRVRHDGLVRRGPQHLAQRQRRQDQTASTDAETAPLEEPQFYQYDIDTTAVAEVWRRGSVVESWLLDLTADRPLRIAGPGWLRRPGVGLGRGPLDLHRRHRRGRARSGAHRLALLPLRLEGPRRLRQQGPLGHAQGIRRPRRETGLTPRAGSGARRASAELRRASASFGGLRRSSGGAAGAKVVTLCPMRPGPGR